MVSLLSQPSQRPGKSQMDAVDMEQSRGIASVRIHVERVIGPLRRKKKAHYQ